MGRIEGDSRKQRGKGGISSSGGGGSYLQVEIPIAFRTDGQVDPRCASWWSDVDAGERACSS